MTLANLPNLAALPNLAQLEAFVQNADSVLTPFASIPQVAFVHQVIVPLLEGALTIGTQIQAQAGNPNADPLRAFIAGELQKLSGVMQPAS
jgi:hypothetical protein